MPEAAYYLFDAAVPNALEWNTPVPIVEALLNRARASVAMGRTHDADADLLDAEQRLTALTDPSMQTRYTGDLLLAKAEARLRADPASARQAATAALQRAEVLSSEYRLAALRLLEGRAALAVGDLPAARASLEAGVDALESKRALVQQRALRVSFLDSVWDVYGELIRLEALSANDPVKALSWVERSRGRMVLDDLGGSQPSQDIAGIQRSLKPDEGILYLEAHPGLLLEWLVTANDIVFKTQDVKEQDLKRSVAQYRAALQARDASTARRYSRIFHTLLIESVGLRGRALTKVAIAPDATLEAGPFSALQDASGEYLAGWLITSVVPSGSVLRALGADRRSFQRAAAIGQPQMTSVLGRMLPALPDASAEMNEIAALYPEGIVIRDREATAAAFVKALEQDDVVQFSGHALANPGVSWQARLILAPGSPDDSGVFSLESLKPLSIRANTVVLAACGTGLGGEHRGEGLLTLGRPLMAAGARAVVVSLWNVDDRAMRMLTTAFHRYLATGKYSPAAALQLAQQSLMRSSEFQEPWAWAALNLQGALD
jgi:CHAT domain-containing protein